MIHLGASARVDLTLWVVGVTDASKELTASVLQAAQPASAVKLERETTSATQKPGSVTAFRTPPVDSAADAKEASMGSRTAVVASAAVVPTSVTATVDSAWAVGTTLVAITVTGVPMVTMEIHRLVVSPVYVRVDTVAVSSTATPVSLIIAGATWFVTVNKGMQV